MSYCHVTDSAIIFCQENSLLSNFNLLLYTNRKNVLYSATFNKSLKWKIIVDVIVTSKTVNYVTVRKWSYFGF